MLGLRVERWEAWGGLTQAAAGSVTHPQRAESFGSPKAAIGWLAANGFRVPYADETRPAEPAHTASIN